MLGVAGARVLAISQPINIVCYIQRQTIKNQKTLGDGDAWRRSREPPAADLQSCHVTKRLPSRVRWAMVTRGAVRGSRLLPTCRVATLQSGSPPTCRVATLQSGSPPTCRAAMLQSSSPPGDGRGVACLTRHFGDGIFCKLSAIKSAKVQVTAEEPYADGLHQSFE